MVQTPSAAETRHPSTPGHRERIEEDDGLDANDTGFLFAVIMRRCPNTEVHMTAASSQFVGNQCVKKMFNSGELVMLLAGLPPPISCR